MAVYDVGPPHALLLGATNPVPGSVVETKKDDLEGAP